MKKQKNKRKQTKQTNKQQQQTASTIIKKIPIQTNITLPKSTY